MFPLYQDLVLGHIILQYENIQTISVFLKDIAASSAVLDLVKA